MDHLNDPRVKVALTHFLSIDQIVFGVQEERIWRANIDKVQDFVVSELSPVANMNDLSVFEIRDEDLNLVRPFIVEGKTITLGPTFFGKGWKLFINGKHRVDLTVKYWERWSNAEMRH